MSDPSPEEKLKVAVQALFQARVVEGPPGDDGKRSVWHLSTQGVELLSLIDPAGEVHRQELTLLEDHCVWANGKGLSTGRIERTLGPSSADAAVVHPDARPVPIRLLRAALALENYRGQDRYILHMQRVLALARQGLVLSGGGAPSPARPAATPPPLPASARAAAPVARGPVPVPTPAPALPPPPRQPSLTLPKRDSEGLIMLAVLAVGLVVGLVLLAFLS